MTAVAATHLIVILLLILLLGTAITIVRMRDLWAAAMLTGIYSFLGASWMLLLDTPDVAFTEADGHLNRFEPMEKWEHVFKDAHWKINDVVLARPKCARLILPRFSCLAETTLSSGFVA